MSTVVTKYAWKRLSEKNSVACDWDDAEATNFELRHAGRAYPESALNFTSKHQAEEIERALIRVFEAGRKDAKSELRNWLSA